MWFYHKVLHPKDAGRMANKKLSDLDLHVFPRLVCPKVRIINLRYCVSYFSLHCLFQGTLLPALDLVDNRSVTIVSCPAGRKVYQVGKGVCIKQKFLSSEVSLSFLNLFWLIFSIMI